MSDLSYCKDTGIVYYSCIPVNELIEKAQSDKIKRLEGWNFAWMTYSMIQGVVILAMLLGVL